jgi:hypothetical protein
LRFLVLALLGSFTPATNTTAPIRHGVQCSQEKFSGTRSRLRHLVDAADKSALGATADVRERQDAIVRDVFDRMEAALAAAIEEGQQRSAPPRPRLTSG